jgi:hypothetical protein
MTAMAKRICSPRPHATVFQRMALRFVEKA